MNKRVDQRTTKQVRLDKYWHQTLKDDARKARASVKELVEACLAESYKEVRRDFGLED